MTRASVLVAAAVIAAFMAAGLWLSLARAPQDAFAACRASQVAGGGAIGGPFTLVDGTGATVTDQDVITKPSLVYFGYTFCPDVCPLDNARNAEATDLLIARGHDVQPVFITVDPGRDTSPVMAEYAGYMHERMIGLTGTADQVRAAAQAYRVYFRKQEGDDEFYLVDHSTFTYLVLPGAGFVEFFRRDETAEDIAGRAACFIDAAVAN